MEREGGERKGKGHEPLPPQYLEEVYAYESNLTYVFLRAIFQHYLFL